MKRINYERIIPNAVGPKLAYHGFKYDETHSYPAQGHYSFARTYWCTTQRVSIAPVEYDIETVETAISQNKDSPTEVPKPLLLIQEPGFRLWLSNKYVLATLQSEHRGVELVPNRGIVFDPDPPSNAEDFINRLKAGPPFKAGKALPNWWEFQGEDELKRVLSEIVRITVTDGLDWFDRQVVDIRRYHENLDRRRKGEKVNSPEESGNRQNGA